MTFRFSRVRQLPRASVLGAAALLVAACSSNGEQQGPREPLDPTDGLPELGEAQLQLERAANCDDLLTRIQDSILVQLGERADELKLGQNVYDDGRPDIDFGGAGGTGGVAPNAPPSDTPQGVPGSASADDGAETPTTPSGNAADPGPSPAPTNPRGPEGEGGGFSGTTVQVKDVDEADIVKTDGDRIYLLHGGTLFMVAGWPADATEILGSTLIEGTPAEMFVKDGKAVVFSRVYGELVNQSMPADSYYYGFSSYTKITVLDVAGSAPSLLRESFIEGEYNAARRHGDVVRAVVQDGFKIPQLGSPSIEYRDAFGQPYPQADVDAQVDAWLARTTRSIRSTDLGDWLPREFTKQNGSLVAVAPRCADYYSPDPGLTQSGVTSLVTLDLADVSAPLAGATVLGNAERVYANEDVVLITQTDYRYSYDADAKLQTIIHRFDIAGTDTAYTASGAVPGTIHDQFSLDERAGVIRVSTTEQPWGRFGGGVALPGGVVSTEPPPAIDPAPPATGTGGAASADPAQAPSMTTPDISEEEALPPSGDAIAPAPEPMPTPLPQPMPQAPTSVSRVLTLGVNGDSLDVLGSTDAFGASEQIFATRFIGDRAYVVTFRQTDPLFVIDLSEPADPHVVGELHIPGFSNYLFPLDDDHLFSIGRDATAEGVVQGLALQIFDVSDPARPALAQRYVYPDASDSPANVDHRAIAFHPDRGVVAFPHTSWQTGESTLEVFQISSATGFTRLGGMGMADELDVDQCIMRYFGYTEGPELDELRARVASDPAMQRDVLVSCRYGHVFRRGLFRDDFVYGISNTGIYVYDITEMAAGALSSLSLPAEVYDSGSGYYGGRSGGGSVSPGMASPPVQVDPGVPTPASGGSAGASSGAGQGGAGGAGAGMEEADKAE